VITNTPSVYSTLDNATKRSLSLHNNGSSLYLDIETFCII